MNWNRIKGCIFDLDGTLLDSMHIWQEVDRKYLSRFGIKFDPKFSEEIKHLTFNESAKYFIDKFHIQKSEEEIKNDWIEMVEEEYRDNIQLKAGVKEFLVLCKRNNMKMCIATSCNYNHAVMALKRLGIYDDFLFIKTCNDVGKNKEYPDIFLVCANEMNLKVNECIVFEDLYIALKVAKEAGFNTIGIHDEQNKKDIHREICDQYIHDFNELMEGLK